MTFAGSVISLIRATQHVLQRGIPGEMVECGVWLGGSAMTIAHTLAFHGDTSKSLYLYDTFQGMSPPTAYDVSCEGEVASKLLACTPRITGQRNIWAYAQLEDVSANLAKTHFPRERIQLIQGRAEDTIPATIPDRIALLRLDTDWYESTRHELIHLYPRLSPGGILIIDDYGFWQGARRATDEYFGPHLPYLHRVDCASRVAVKTTD